MRSCLGSSVTRTARHFSAMSTWKRVSSSPRLNCSRSHKASTRLFRSTRWSRCAADHTGSRSDLIFPDHRGHFPLPKRRRHSNARVMSSFPQSSTDRPRGCRRAVTWLLKSNTPRSRTGTASHRSTPSAAESRLLAQRCPDVRNGRWQRPSAARTKRSPRRSSRSSISTPVMFVLALATSTNSATHRPGQRARPDRVRRSVRATSTLRRRGQ